MNTQMRMDFVPTSPEVASISTDTVLRGKFDSHTHLCTFLFSGKATFTIRSLKTLTRFTYKISEPPKTTGKSLGPVGFFVSVLTGPDNSNDFTYLGNIYKESRNYSHGRKSRIGFDAPSATAFEWFYNCGILTGRLLEDKCEIWHEGRCGRCNYKLTVPESIESGIGPECAKKVAATNEGRRWYV